jgi:hypothetical protein
VWEAKLVGGKAAGDHEEASRQAALKGDVGGMVNEGLNAEKAMFANLGIGKAEEVHTNAAPVAPAQLGDKVNKR